MLAAGCPAAAQPAWIFDFEAGWLHDSNLPRAQQATDIKSGGALSAAVSAGGFYAIDGRSSVAFTADGRAVRFDGYSGLNLDAIGASLSFRHKFGLGLAVPWAQASFTAGRENYGTSIRDSDRYSLTLEAGQRFSERFEGSLSAVVEHRNALNSSAVAPGFPGDPFETYGRAILARGSYAVTERLDLTFAYGVRSGDVVSSTRRNFQIFQASAAIAPDPAFGPDYYAYRLNGVTRTPSLGLGWTLSEYSSLRVVYSRELTYGANQLNYYNTVINASFQHRF